jgi:hypothetical protein
MIAIPQGKWARPGLVSGARTFVLHEVGSVSSTTPKNCVQGPAVEVRTTLHYLALGRHGLGRGTDRLLAEAEVIPGGWPFPLDLQQWSGIARTAHPNLRRRDPTRPGEGKPFGFGAMLRAASNRPSQHGSVAISKNAAPLFVGLRGVPLLLCARYFK